MLDDSETASLDLSRTKQAWFPDVVMMLPAFGSVTPLGDSPSIENYTGYRFGGNSGLSGGQTVSTWGCVIA